MIFGLALTGVPDAGGLPALPTDGVAIWVSIDIFGVECGTGDALPGRGFRTASPEGSGFLGLDTMLSLTPPGEGSLGAPVGSAVLTLLDDDPSCTPRISARRLGLPVFSVTIRLFLDGFSPFVVEESVFGRFGTGVPCS